LNEPVIFLGPSLSRQKAKNILEADYRPPAKKGDLLRLADLTKDIAMVGLVDGFFLQDYPPTPIEVYQLATKKNILLVGAASLGALRAVELEKFGMIGIGKIFELYKTGKIDGDDEVAVTFEEGGHTLQSEAMIDIRFNLFIARRKGIIDENTKRQITKVAKNVYFPFRNYADILDLSKRQYPLSDSYIESFRAYITSNRESLKERDAIKLLKYMRQRIQQVK
jgi:TfuA protein